MLLSVCAQLYKTTQDGSIIRGAHACFHCSYLHVAFAGLLEVMSDYAKFQITFLSMDSTLRLFCVCQDVLRLFAYATESSKPKVS
jgi:hypothetical protein